MFILATSGLRAGELVQLRWKDMENVDDTWKAYFTGKGGKAAEQELYTACECSR